MSNSEFFYLYENKKEFHFSLSFMRDSMGSHPLHNLLLESDKYLQWIIRFHVKNWWYLLCFNKSRFENISFIKQKKPEYCFKNCHFHLCFSCGDLIYKGRFLANYITMEISSYWIEMVQNNGNTNTSLHIVLFIYQLLSLMWGLLLQILLSNRHRFSNIYSQFLSSILILRIN